jgi:hypothetical protein
MNDDEKAQLAKWRTRRERKKKDDELRDRALTDMERARYAQLFYRGAIFPANKRCTYLGVLREREASFHDGNGIPNIILTVIPINCH